MAPVRSSVVFLIFAIISVTVDAAHHQTSAPAPAPASAVDCSSLILIMMDCLSFVSSGSTAAKPEGTCCSGLKTVLNTDAECLCEGFKSSASLGVSLNVTKALALPTACKLHAPSIADCGLSVPPAAAPGVSQAAGAPKSGGANALAPAPDQGSSASCLFPVAIASLASGLLVLLFFYF